MEKLKGDIKLLRNLLDRARENPDKVVMTVSDPDTSMTLMDFAVREWEWFAIDEGTSKTMNQTRTDQNEVEFYLYLIEEEML